MHLCLIMAHFSVIISLYNKEDHISETLESVLAQTFQDFEIIIVNDGSTDSSETIVTSMEDERIKYFYQENQGASAGRNAALSKASGQYMALLDADDLWQPNYLETIRQLILSYPKESVFASAVTLETMSNAIPSVYSIKNIKDKQVYVVDYFESSTINTVLTSSSTVLHHSVFEKIGNYNTSIKSGQDTDLWIRIGINYKVVFINESLVTYRYAKQSLSNKTKRIADKLKLDDYVHLEENNPSLKKFMDLNRFSMAILSKLGNDHESFKRYEKGIDYKNLNKKQKFLINQPAIIVQLFHNSKRFLERSGVHLSVFK